MIIKLQKGFMHMSVLGNIPHLLKKDDFLSDTPVFQNTQVCTDLYVHEIGLSRLHQHQFIEISYVVDGVGTHRILNEAYTCRKGSLCILNIAVPHGYFAIEDMPPPVIHNLLFDVSDIFDNELSEIGSKHYMYGLFSSNNFAINISLKPKQLSIVEDLYNSISEEISAGKENWQNVIKAKMHIFLITLKRIIDESADTSSVKFSHEQQAVSTAVQLTNAMYHDSQFTLADVAQALYTSTASASRMFRTVTGEYFSDYLRSVRMRHAVDLVTNTQLSNEEIATRCGYKDLPTFYKQFKNSTGFSPGEYRKATQEREDINTEKESIIMSILQEISEKLQKGKAKDVAALVTSALEEGVAPEKILNEGLVDGMNIIGGKFRNNEVFVPEVLVAARAMNSGLKVLKPALSNAGVEPIGKAVICTVKGDMHDIGKNLVKMMIEGQGIECVDLGVDVEPAAIVNAVQESGAQIVCLSALLTTTMMGQKEVIDALVAAGIRDKVKVMVGGAPVTQEFADEIGADCYTLDAASAAQQAKRLILEG
ncbi:MAG: helix-turn-helix domain-containing protein [Ruminococcaceae bacterium]|nr:helix-turn-helix domain-containing protein [Oscillospiraceae bacterium]